MTSYKKIPFKKGELNLELSKFFSELLEKQVVSAVLVPANGNSEMVKQTLFVDPGKTDTVDPFAPIVPVNSAKIVSSLTAKPSGKKMAMVLRSCEVRATIELAKLNQVHLEDVLLIGMDCYGRFENKDFLKLKENKLTSEKFLQEVQTGEPDFNGAELVEACRICEFPEAENVDIRLCKIGTDPDSFGLEGISEQGKAVLEKVGFSGDEMPSQRTKAVEALAKKRKAELDQKLDDYHMAINSIQSLEESLANCINCYNCRVACPVCYCKECVYVTDTFRHEGEQFLGWAKKEGALKMPTDTAFYHLTRMTHIGTSCVGCGQCTSACPNGISLTIPFRSIARVSQNRFEYEAGRSLQENQPLSIFHDDELVEVTGQVK